MRLTPWKLVAVAFCAATLSVPTNARAFGLGTVLGLVREPLHIIGRGVGLPMRHSRRAPAHVVAPPEAAKQPPAETTEPARAEARLEPPRGRLPTLPERQPPMGWPESSPNVYEDLIGYILWPQDYADRLWTHGTDDIMGAALTPVAQSDDMTALIANGMCSSQARELADKPIARLADTLELRPDQQANLDELRAALGVAVERGRAALCGTATASADDRFRPMIDALWNMWDATLLIRTPLEKFYDSLTPDQKAQLTSASPAGAKAEGACAAQRTAEWPAERIERAMGTGQRPTQEQRRSLEALHQRFTELAQFLATSCPQESDPSPILRLSAAGDRMNALMYAVLNMRPAVEALQVGQPKPKR